MLTILFNAQTPPATAPPVNTGLPIIIGVAQVGQTLTTTDGSWTQSPTGFTYQWQLDGTTNIVGATSSTYVIQASDVGHTLNSVVTATNAFGSASASSLPTAVVTIPPVVSRREEGGAGPRRRYPDRRKERNEEALALVLIEELW